MIEARNVEKSFGSKHVLHQLTACFEAGKTNLVIGRSGSGKTVLLKILSGLLPPDCGEVLFEGVDALSMTGRDRRMVQQQMGMIFQGAALFDSLSVLDNVAFPLRQFTHASRKQIIRRVHECLDRVDLHRAIRLMPSDLSGGMKKRVAIARAIALRPKYLFCDEPNSGLDPQTSLLIDSLIHEITHEGGLTTIINTHDMNSVLAIGDSVAFIESGNLEWTGTGQEVMTARNEKLSSFVFATPLAQRAREASMKER